MGSLCLGVAAAIQCGVSGFDYEAADADPGGARTNMNPDIEIRHLRYFLTVAETENFTRAAERLGVTQPSVSQQIKDLEDKLGTLLLRRSGKRVKLTEAGEAFAQTAAVVVRKLEEARESVSRVAGALSGHLEIGVAPLLNLAWIPGSIARMATEFPGVTITVTERATHAIETEVEANRCDVGLGILTRRSPNLRCEPLTADELWLVVSEQHPLAVRSSLAIADLAEQSLALLPSTFDVRAWTDGLFRQNGLRARVAVEINSIAAVVACVQRCDLATLLPKIALAGRDASRLKTIKLTGKTSRIDFGVITSRAIPATAAVREFVRIVKDVAADKPARAK
jgi:LysR family transcriptional regulator, cyn operon transcriptional activator